MERLRRIGVGVVAAFVLLPPRLVIMLGLGLGAVYLFILAVRSTFSIGNRGVGVR